MCVYAIRVLYASVDRIPLKIKYSTKALQLCHIHNGKVIAEFRRILFFSCFFFVTRIHKQGNWICFIATRCSCSFTWISDDKSDSSIHTMKLFTYQRLYLDFYICTNGNLCDKTIVSNCDIWIFHNFTSISFILFIYSFNNGVFW